MQTTSATHRVAVVTGAARGIGAATVAHLVGTGWQVVAVDAPEGTEVPGITRPLGSEQDLRDVADRCGDAVVAHPADVRDADALRDAVARAVDTFGRLDAAVAGAAVIAGGRPMWEEDPVILQSLLAVDVTGIWNLARAAVPVLLADPHPSGRFVAMAGSAASTGIVGLASHGVAQHAVLGLVRGLAADLRGTGVSAVGVAPGATRTAMLEATRELYGLDDVEQLAARQASGRLLEPAEVAAVVAFLCEPASACVNGSLVAADGGFGL